MTVMQNNICLRGAEDVSVSTSAWHAGGPGSILGHGRHGIFGIKTLAFHIGDCVSLGNQRTTLMLVPSQFLTQKNDKHMHRQC